MCLLYNQRAATDAVLIVASTILLFVDFGENTVHEVGELLEPLMLFTIVVSSWTSSGPVRGLPLVVLRGTEDNADDSRLCTLCNDTASVVSNMTQ